MTPKLTCARCGVWWYEGTMAPQTGCDHVTSAMALLAERHTAPPRPAVEGEGMGGRCIHGFNRAMTGQECPACADAPPEMALANKALRPIEREMWQKLLEHRHHGSIVDRTDFIRIEQAAFLCATIAAARITSLSAQLAEARQILAHTDIGSLPNDWTIKQVAEARIDDMLKLRDQVRDTCTRAEKAEAQLAEARKALENIHNTIVLDARDGHVSNVDRCVVNIARRALWRMK